MIEDDRIVQLDDFPNYAVELLRSTAMCMQGSLIAKLKHIGELDSADYPLNLLKLLGIRKKELYEEVRKAQETAKRGTAVNVRINDKLTYYFTSRSPHNVGPNSDTLYMIAFLERGVNVHVNVGDFPYGFARNYDEVHEDGAVFFGLFGMEEVVKRLCQFLVDFSKDLDADPLPPIKGPLAADADCPPESFDPRPLTDLEIEILGELKLLPELW